MKTRELANRFSKDMGYALLILAAVAIVVFITEVMGQGQDIRPNSSNVDSALTTT
jgi:hypothetical protein